MTEIITTAKELLLKPALLDESAINKVLSALQHQHIDAADL